MSETIPSEVTGPFGIKISAVPRNGEELPFAYFEPSTDGKLTWHCGYDTEQKIISVFTYDFGATKDRRIAVLPSMKEANFARASLIENGWRKLDPPKITTTYPGESKPRDLTRKQKRYLQRKLAQLTKNNPFANEKDVEVPDDAAITDEADETEDVGINETQAASGGGQ